MSSDSLSDRPNQSRAYKGQRLRTRRKKGAAVLLLLLIAVGLGSLNAPKRIETAVAPPATFFASPDSGDVDGGNAFIDELLPKLDVLVGEGSALQSLGQARSRNILELTVRMQRFRDALADIDRFLTVTSVPTRFEARMSELQVQMANANNAIDGSVSAIKTFDWDYLGVQVDLFGLAIDSIRPIAISLASELE